MPLPPPGAGLGPQLLAVVGRAGCQLWPPPWIYSSPAQICGWASSSGSSPRKEKGWICRDKAGGEWKGQGQVFGPCLPSLPPPSGCSSTVAGFAGLLGPWPQGTSDGLKSPGLAFLLCCCCLVTKLCPILL